MNKKIYLITLLMLVTAGLFAESITINRDKTPLKNGPGAFYENLVFLQLNTTVENLGPASEDDGWLKVSFKGLVDNKKSDITGYLSRLSISEKKASKDPFDSLRSDSISGGSAKNQIAPGSYTAAIKGFLQNYSSKNKYTTYSYEDIYSFTSFTNKDYFQIKGKVNLSYFPKRGELLGLDRTHITESMEALSGAIVLNAVSKHELVRSSESVKVNVIANVLSRQTIDYDKQYFVWIVRNKEPFAFSGPGGAIFISDGMIKLLNDDKEVIAVIGHEIGHIAMRHGIRDIALEQARKNMEASFDELDESLDSDYAAISEDLEDIIGDALKAAALVRDDIQEFEADDISMELLRRYRIERKYLASALGKVFNNLNADSMNEYKLQTQRRLARVK
ncbi:MAG: hypothetical protein A2015_00540 [Spirochaetes bacterium GWF1_31_7]|nr:MAG: hypothetical protein A2Y30_03970 [Spirochaetes bacterium GWE1_32_154]OHD45160.1 MAG: hypothetical protein A2Y29_15925 [Spirochaetes bacterium GWE2_31_10]OHD51070.1 MAG: hypothetical protein A2015_00540 [Spirochaetes bacterium GWF1_31_7]OHD80603.1 MAG: hypothetical protein A2355_07730 [Spirochaetes bacterium RIFOXYB1_FULL_32_8]HBD94394.1 hypothetical protein [Spirochaetia bacterium]